jgi:ribose transport system permease protein
VKRLTARETVATLLGYRVVIILLATIVVSVTLVPSFLSVSTLGLSLDRAATMGIIAVGLTVLLIAGQIDLSSGAILALSGITAIALQPTLGPLGAALVGVLVGAFIGLGNAILVVTLGINSLLATLAMMLMVRAVAHWVTGSTPVPGHDIAFGLAVSRPIAGIFTLRSIIFVVAVLLLHVWLTRTISGRNLFAVGSNPTAATGSGIPTSKYLFLAFIFAGTMAGLAGVVQSLAVNSGSPVFGETITVAVIAAVVVGGTRLEGGRGSALGTLGGVLTIAALTTAMEYQNVPAYVQQIVTGSILILLILLDRATAGTKRRSIRIGRLIGRRAGDEFSKVTNPDQGDHK